MAVYTRITEKNPRNGALPSEQTAKHGAEGEQQSGIGLGMAEQDKPIYKLVENNVQFVGETLGENLRFNSETLTNVLYDNIYNLLGEKFEEDKFINWLVDELVKSGSVTKVQDNAPKTEKPNEQPKEEVVYELDDSAYQELQVKVGSAIELLKANKLNIFKALTGVDDGISEMSEDNFGTNEKRMFKLRDEQITSLVSKLRGNQQTLEDYVQENEDWRTELDDQVNLLKDASTKRQQDFENTISQNSKIVQRLKKTLDEIGKKIGVMRSQDGKDEKHVQVRRQVGKKISQNPETKVQPVKFNQKKQQKAETSGKNELVKGVKSSTEKAVSSSNKQTFTEKGKKAKRFQVSSGLKKSTVFAKNILLKLGFDKSVADLLDGSQTASKKQTTKVNRQPSVVKVKNLTIVPQKNPSVPAMGKDMKSDVNKGFGYAKMFTLDEGLGKRIQEKAIAKRPSSAKRPVGAPIARKPQVGVKTRGMAKTMPKALPKAPLSASTAKNAFPRSSALRPPLTRTLPFVAPRRPSAGVLSNPRKAVASSRPLAYVRAPTSTASLTTIAKKPVPLAKGVERSPTPTVAQGFPPSPASPPPSGAAKGKKQSFFGRLFGRKLVLPKNTTTTKPKKPSLAKRIGIKIGNKYRRVKMGIQLKVAAAKQKISDSPIGKVYRFVKGAAKVVFKTVKIAAKAVKVAAKVAIATAKVMLKTAKLAIKGFIGASMLIGKGLQKTTMATVRGIKKLVKLAHQGKLVKTFLQFTGASVINKLGWRAIKWGVRKLWRWLKRSVVKLGGMFLRRFRLGKFINKIGTYTGKLSKGLRDKKYMFLVKPIASFLVTVFSFTMGVVMTPIKFMQWMVPSMLERFRDILSDIKSATKSVLKSTWSFFKRILFNPVTIILLIAALVYFFGPKLWNWLTQGVLRIKDRIVTTVMHWASKIFEWGKKIWDVVSTIGKGIFQFIDWLTDPDGWVFRIVHSIIGLVLKVKGWVNNMMKVAGQDTIDMLCMWIAGDWIGIAFNCIKGMLIKFWDKIKNSKFVKWIKGLTNGVVAAKRLVWDMPKALFQSLTSAAKNIVTGRWNRITQDFCKPWKEWWNGMVNLWNDTRKIFNPPTEYNITPFKIKEAPSKNHSAIKRDVTISSNMLRAKGMYSEQNLQKMDEIAKTQGYVGKSSVFDRIKYMVKLYDINSTQVTHFQDFMKKLWEIGKVSKDAASKTLKAVLESPDFSQKLLSAFFYYDPASGKTLSLRPTEYIGQFVDNIRQMVGIDVERDDIEVLKTIIKAMEQMNIERWHIINLQGKALTGFLEDVYKINTEKGKNKQAMESLEFLTHQLNDGTLFNHISKKFSFAGVKQDASASRELESLTGEKFGDSNPLLKVKPVKVTVPKGQAPSQTGTQTRYGERELGSRDSDFQVKTPPKTPNKFGNVTISGRLSPVVSQREIDAGQKKEENLAKRYSDYIYGLNMMRAKERDETLEQRGIKHMTYEEFKKKVTDDDDSRLTPEQKQAKDKAAKETNAKRVAGMRLISDLHAWQNQGIKIDETASMVRLSTKDIPIIQLNTDGLEQDVYMFSPMWRHTLGAAKLSDEELQRRVTQGVYDDETMDALSEASEEEQRQQEEEERLRERERQILDYSATVNNGYIEVKIGEDTTAMSEAYNEHMFKRMQASVNHNEAQLEEMGLQYYSWEDWQRHYRKEKGLPEDGIMRIKFEATNTPKHDDIDWSERAALSVEELKQHGVERSTTGSIMIPLDKAMAVAKSLFDGATTMYSIRDGLEVMKEGLKDETNKLKKRNKKGPNTVVGVSPMPAMEGKVIVNSPDQAAEQ